VIGAQLARKLQQHVFLLALAGGAARVMHHVYPRCVAEVTGEHFAHFAMAFVYREAMRLLALGGSLRFMPMDKIAETLGGKLIGRGGRGGGYWLRLGMQRLEAPGWK